MITVDGIPMAELDQQTRAKRMATFRKVVKFETIEITSDIVSVWAAVRAFLNLKPFLFNTIY